MPSPPPPAPSCPRCDYDLAGEIASWTTQCPLASTCPECGDDVDISSAFAAANHAPRWSFEHHRGVRVWLRWLTVLPRPGRLWQGLQRTPSIRLARLTLGVCMAMALTYVAVVAFVLVWFIAGATQVSNLSLAELLEFYIDRPSNLRWVLTPFPDPWMFAAASPSFSPHFGWAPLVIVLTPLVFLISPAAFRRDGARPRLVLRACLLALPIAGLVLCSSVLPAMLGWTLEVLTRIGHPAPEFIPQLASLARPYTGWIITLPALTWTAWAQWCLARRYLRMPKADARRIAIGGTAAMAIVTSVALSLATYPLIFSPFEPLLRPVLSHFWP